VPDNPLRPESAPTRRRRMRADGPRIVDAPSSVPVGSAGQTPAPPGSRRAARLAASAQGTGTLPPPGVPQDMPAQGGPAFGGTRGFVESPRSFPGPGMTGAPGFGGPSGLVSPPMFAGLAPGAPGAPGGQNWFAEHPVAPTSPMTTTPQPPAVMNLDTMAGAQTPGPGSGPATGTIVLPAVDGPPAGAPPTGQFGVPHPPTGRMRRRHTISLPVAFDDERPEKETMAIRTARPSPSVPPPAASPSAPPTGVIAVADAASVAQQRLPDSGPGAYGPAEPGSSRRGGRRSRRESGDASAPPPPPAPAPPVPDLSAGTAYDPAPYGTRTRGDRGNAGRYEDGHHERSQGSASRAGRNLPMAILSGAALGGLALASLLIRKEAFIGLVAVAAVLSVWELARALGAKEITVPVVPLGVGAVGMLVSAFVAGEDGLLVSFALTAFGALLWRLIDGVDDAMRDVAASVFTAAYVPFLAGFTILMLGAPDGAKRVIVFILVTIASDTGGYVAGVLFGRHPMAPTVSPKKSWEGFTGSVLACCGTGVACVLLVLQGPWWAGLAVGGVAVVTATVGDLCESLIKRDLGIKDMGHLLPGHGGVLDRVDSLLLTAPVVYVLLSLWVPIS
jgi:phosphatidate cytidylyltransferase